MDEADAMVAFRIDDSNGTLTLVGHATHRMKYPRHFALDPKGGSLYVCNQRADTIVRCTIDADTGALAVADEVIGTPTPACIAFA
jgi:6-phosphogluconolactonase